MTITGLALSLIAGTLLVSRAAWSSGTEALKAADDGLLEALNRHDAEEILGRFHKESCT